MVIRNNMSCGKRYYTAEAGWRLCKKLSRNNPDVFIWSGVTMDPPYTVLIRASEEIEVPETTMSSGISYPVQFLFRGE